MQVLASSIALTAAALGVSGITGGFATTLLRNSPASVTACLGLGGIGVMIGAASGFIRADVKMSNYGKRRIWSVAGTLLLLALVLGLVGRESSGATPFATPPRWVWIVTFLSVFAVAVALAWMIGGRRSDTRAAAPLVAFAGAYLFGVAVLALLLVSTTALRSASRPTVSASISAASGQPGYVTVSVKASANGMRNTERYDIVVRPGDAPLSAVIAPIYQTFAGAGADGNFEYSFTVTFRVDPSYSYLVVSMSLSDDRTGATTRPAGCSPSRPGTESVPSEGVTCTVVTVG